MRHEPVAQDANRFALLYMVANVGAFICFIPLLGLLLPQRAMALAPDDGVRLLSAILLSGAVAASLANIAAGRLSDWQLDRHGSRLPMVAAGLAATLASFAALAAAATPAALLAAFLLFQLCFNLLFAPFNALATDHVADAIKGRMFGLLSLGLPLAQLVIVGLVGLGIEGIAARLAVIAALGSIAILPLLLFGRASAGPPMAPPAMFDAYAEALPPPSRLRRDFVLAWVARLLIQFAAVVAGSYLLIHLAVADRAGNRAEAWFSALSLTALVLGLIVGLVVGRWSDRVARRRPFLWATALLVALGCALVGIGTSWLTIASGYGLFSIGMIGFLTIDGAVIAQLIGKAGRRGSRLGIMNLTNTLPSLIVPLLALAFGWITTAVTAWLFLAAALGALIAAALVAALRTIV